MKNILLIEPDFPIPQKSKNHKNFLPIGLLKIASYLREKGEKIKLIRGLPNNPRELRNIKRFNPNEVWITSLFTYWAEHVRDTVKYYKNIFPKAKIIVGGIFASLLPKKKVKQFTGCDEVYQGVIPEAENLKPAYDLLKNSNPHPIDYQIIHTSRGCKRKCSFCGTWKIEPEFLYEKSIKDKITYKKLVFYDNNFLMNPYIENVIEELINLKKDRKIFWCESQSGFDGRILMRKPHLAIMLKKAGFRYPRIAWDGIYDKYPKIKNQIDILKKAGYSSKEIYIFVLYNCNIPFDEMEEKRIKCWKWKVQIADCRFRSLDHLFDNYDPRIIGQTSDDYYIHKKWTDALVKQYRKNIREQNICVRHGFPFYSKDFEHKIFKDRIMRKTKFLETKYEKERYLKNNNISYWFPSKIRYPIMEKDFF